MPLPVLFLVDGKFFIGDGLHRITGMNLAEVKEHVFEVMKGSKAGLHPVRP